MLAAMQIRPQKLHRSCARNVAAAPERQQKKLSLVKLNVIPREPSDVPSKNIGSRLLVGDVMLIRKSPNQRSEILNVDGIGPYI